MLTKEQQKIVEKNLALVTFIAKKYFSKTDYIKNQDILQEGVYAMIKALPRYDENKAKFSTYMYPTISGHLKRFVGYRDRIIPIPHQKHLKQETQDKANNARNVFSLNREIFNNSDNEHITLMDILPSEVDIEEDVINKIIISKAIKLLEWKEKIIIIYRFYFDLNQTHIGKLMSLSQVHVHRLEKRALKNMKEYLS